MADDQVDLTPENIPGASFIEEEIEKLTVSQLKFWLKCLRINQNGNEKELLDTPGRRMQISVSPKNLEHEYPNGHQELC